MSTAARPRITTGIDLPLAPSCGSMIFCSDLYREMADRARTTFLALPPADPAWQHGFEETVLAAATKAPYGPGFAAYVDALTAEVRQHLDRARPHVIHAQHLGFGLSLAFVRAAQGTPVVAIAHGTDVIAADADPLARDVLTEIVAGATTVVTPNQALAERIGDLTGHRYRDKTALVPWGIPLARAARTAPATHADTRPLRLLHAGRLDANKSTRTAVEAMALTEHRHELTVIGSGPEQDNLQQQARELGLTGRVRFEPFAPRGTLWERFADFDAFVFTTSGLEAFGLVAIEAQAHALPVIYSDVAGMTQTLGSAGLPYTPGDAADLAQAIDKLAADRTLRTELSTAGLANASCYGIVHSAHRLDQITRDAIGAAA
ncbi:glycosyltransferase family 4 protein [Kitasatospora sp. YST-16]|uniref:glycosyltransferase family 4 protein n=1 Tax=Kitasatospora sp. YST-16 TaxID=2998080 RepID=UPI002284BC9D|nr:glycosyltransferase family 4 protein [Kitasatospora sp. YST-16]WAL74552.1 glycosyltransferase family 4 protein [Kitasatospora sp. YST-16]WNW40610.1 glycosyltransferase family 4 protein [Streptomyces sp. Li-HN-5-13]